MASVVHEKIKRLLLDAEAQYHRLVLLVGESGSGKTPLLHLLAEELDTSVINVNLALCTQLLALPPKQRALRLPMLLDEIISEQAIYETGSQSVIILDNLEILFDTGLQNDPLRLLQGISKNRTILASWNGRVEENHLLYAEIGHPEYRKYGLNSLLFVTTE